MKWGNLGSALIFTSIGALGCGAADEPGEENVGSVSQAQIDCADCTVAPLVITDFNRFTGELTGIPVDTATPITLRVTPETVMGFPPDPILPAGLCGIHAVKWIRVLTWPEWELQDAYDHLVIELLPKLARDECTAEVTWLAGAAQLEAIEIVFP